MTVIEQLIDNVASGIVAQKTSGKFSPEDMARMKADLNVTDKIMDAIFGALIDNLPDEKVEALNALLDEGNEEKLEAFFVENVKALPNLEGIVTAAIDKVAKSL